MSRQVHYTGYQNPNIRHEPWCKSPHPHAVVECTCPASSSLGYNTPLQTMSVDQYEGLYKPAPIPVHKLKWIRHTRHKLRPKDKTYWPKHPRTGQPYDPQEHGYPADWLDTPYGDAREEYVEFGPDGLPTNLPVPGPDAVPSYPTPAGVQQERVRQEPVLEAKKVSRNYWEVDMQSPEDAQRWHTDPTYNPPSYTQEQLERAQRRQPRLQPPVPQQTPVVPTQYANLPPAQQLQAYPPNGQPMIPHTQRACRAPLIVDIPNAAPGSPPAVVECDVENEHPGQPHMAKVQPRRAGQTIYLTWVE